MRQENLNQINSMCFCLRNLWSRISHNMSMTHTQPDVNDYPPTHLLHNSHNISHMLIKIFRKSGLTRLLSCLLSILSGYTSCYTILKPSFNPLMCCFQSIDLHNASPGTSPPGTPGTSHRRHRHHASRDPSPCRRFTSTMTWP